MRTTTPQSEQDTAYLHALMRIPNLSYKDELQYADAWKHEHSESARQKLAAAHMKLVVKIASQYKGYGFQITDMVGEGTAGLMNAIDKFKPEKGFRLSTYAEWWIRASITEHILANWSLVKITTTADNKKLFFKLKSTIKKLGIPDDGELAPESASAIASHLDVPAQEVHHMHRRLGKDSSLNAPTGLDGMNPVAWIDRLKDDRDSHGVVVIDAEEYRKRYAEVSNAFKAMNLSPHKKDILRCRLLKDEPDKLRVLATRHNLSKESVRQVEVVTVDKIKQLLSLAECKRAAAQITAYLLDETGYFPAPREPSEQLALPRYSAAKVG